jgi:hypothetical protein
MLNKIIIAENSFCNKQLWYVSTNRCVDVDLQE